MLPNVQTFDIRVKRVKFHRDDTLQTVFDGEVLEWRPRKKEWTPTRQVVTCSGYFFNLIENDHIHVKAEEVEHELYGPQWQVYLSERVTPGTEAEMLKFLTSIKGIGQVIGRRLIDALWTRCNFHHSDRCHLSKYAWPAAASKGRPVSGHCGEQIL